MQQPTLSCRRCMCGLFALLLILAAPAYAAGGSQHTSPAPAAAFDSSIASVTPLPETSTAPDSGRIEVTFARPLVPGSVTAQSLVVTGSIQGRCAGRVEYNDAQRLLSFTPAGPFKPGELITATLPRGLATENGDSIRAFGWTFSVMPHGGTGRFSLSRPLYIGGVTFDSPTGDFDHDGKPDIVFLDNFIAQLQFVNNNGSLSFGKTVERLQPPVGPFGAGDIDGDGRPEVLVGRNDGQSLAIFRQDDQRRLLNVNTVTTGHRATSMATADMDGDGLPDLVMCDQWEGLVYILQNRGGYVFAPAAKTIPIAPVTMSFDRVAVADLDGDGRLDIVMTSANDLGIRVFRQQDSLQFSAPYLIDTGQPPARLFFVDVDGDGDPDIAVQRRVGNSYDLVFVENLGAMQFRLRSSGPVLSNAYVVAPGDFDGDGKPDFVTSDANNGRLSFHRNTGGFAFSSITLDSSGEGLLTLCPADLDGDGDLDLFGAGTGSAALTVLRNREAVPEIALADSAHEFKLTKPDSTRSWVLQTVNSGIGRALDVKSITWSDRAFSVSPTSGTIQPGDTLHVTVAFRPALGGLHRDSLLISSNDTARPVATVYLSGRGEQVVSCGPASYSFAAPESTEVSVRFNVHLQSATLTDSTVIVAGSQSGRCPSASLSFDRTSATLQIKPRKAFHPGETVTITLTSGIRTEAGEPPFDPRTWEFTVKSRSSSVRSRQAGLLSLPLGSSDVKLRDFDGDGLLDIAVVCTTEPAVVVYRNLGAFGFAPAATISTAANAGIVFAEDFDGDGDTDIGVPLSQGGMYFLRNDGGFAFTGLPGQGLGTFRAAVAADFDHDGKIDLAGSDASGMRIVVVRNTGSFGFKHAYTDTSLAGLPVVHAADLDNDGNIDLTAGTNGSWILRGDGSGGFTALPEPGFYMVPTAHGDLNKDGMNDLAGRIPFQTGIYAWALGEGDFRFQQRTSPPPIYPPPAQAANASLAIVDLDGEGTPDLLLADGGNLRIIRNDGRANFSELPSDRLSLYSTVMATGDLDNNGIVDAVAIDKSNGGTLYILEHRPHFIDIQLSRYQYDFGLVPLDSSRSVSFAIRNLGSIQARVDSITWEAGNPAFSVAPRQGVIAPGDSLRVNVTFTPTSQLYFSDSLSSFSDRLRFWIPDSTVSPLPFAVTGTTRQVLVDSLAPAQAYAIADTAPFTIRFMQSLVSSSVTPAAVRLSGSWSGAHTTSVTYDQARRVMTIRPAGRLLEGEKVHLTLTDSLRLASGNPIKVPMAWDFRVRTRAASAIHYQMPDIQMPVIAGGHQPVDVCAADLNFDGITDLVSANPASSSATFMFFNDRGTAPMAIMAGTGAGPSRVAAGDFNGDGKVDVAVLCDPLVSVFRNNNGPWPPFSRTDLTLQAGLAGMAVADFNGDGMPDIAVGNRSQRTITLLINDGRGGFRTAASGISGVDVKELAAADFDVDGYQDLAVTQWTGSGPVLFQNAGGLNFKPAGTLGIAAELGRAFVVDFNNDGRPDITAQNGAMYANRGKWVFESANDRVTLAASSMAWGDLDGNGDEDLALIDNTYGSPSGNVYKNHLGTLTGFSWFLSKTASPSLVTGDFNGDGGLDIAYVNTATSTASWLLNKTGPRFRFSREMVYFDSVALGEEASIASTLTNTGSMALTIDTVWIPGRSFTASVSKRIVPAGDSATVTVTFRPDSLGTFCELLTIATDNNTYSHIDVVGFGSATTGIRGNDRELPAEYALSQNYPNPFNPATTIRYALPVRSRVTIAVFSTLGQEVARPVEEVLEAGYHQARFDGSGLASGVYFYRMRAAAVDAGAGGKEFVKTHRLILLR